MNSNFVSITLRFFQQMKYSDSIYLQKICFYGTKKGLTFFYYIVRRILTLMDIMSEIMTLLFLVGWNIDLETSLEIIVFLLKYKRFYPYLFYYWIVFGALVHYWWGNRSKIWFFEEINWKCWFSVLNEKLGTRTHTLAIGVFTFWIDGQ